MYCPISMQKTNAATCMNWKDSNLLKLQMPEKKQDDVAKELFKKSSVKLLIVFFAYTGYLSKGVSWELVQLVSFDRIPKESFDVLCPVLEGMNPSVCFHSIVTI